MVRIFLSDGQKLELSNRKANEVVDRLNRTAHAGLAVVELDKGIWINPSQVTSVFQVESESK
ncbi:hypothetical protein [Alicyclobacillus pomorum]|jgi:hypothetical protein|uniref:hypothetical protein n=1 Tax=Alicyclobacillus pomorum TaxID=204470 RepID=UPI00047DA09D|nr:hypothetical protein [Alicyclobacillus pomorum]